jgi:hypothetical protein
MKPQGVKQCRVLRIMLCQPYTLRVVVIKPVDFPLILHIQRSAKYVPAIIVPLFGIKIIIVISYVFRDISVYIVGF